MDPGDLQRLRTALRDLVALSTIPAAWVGREPPAIAAGLADVLVGSLHLDFAFVRLCDPNGGAAVDVTRGDAWNAFPEWLQRHVAADGRYSRREVIPDVGGGQPCRGLVMPIGVNADGGLVAVACDRSDFPSETDQLLLSVAANHAATAFQSARLIHERRRAEEQLRLARDELEIKVTKRAGELRRTTAELQTILDASPVGIVLFGRDQTVQRCNPAFERLVGWKADEIVGRRIPLPESIEKRWASLLAQLIRGEGSSGLEIRIMRKDGSEFDAALACAPFTDERGRPAGFVANIEDISDRKRAEEALRRSETYLAEAQRLSHTGSWALDIATGELTHSSEENFRLFGFDPQSDRPSTDEFRQRIHPEDRERVAAIVEKAVRDGMEFEADYRIVLPDGTVKCLHAVGHSVLNAAGDLVQFVGTSMDVTERRRAEAEHQAHLWFLESMDWVNRAMQGTNDLEQMMSDVLDVVLSVFNCDRSWLVHPCDPDAASWNVPMEHTRLEVPGAFALGRELPVDPDIARAFRTVRASSSPVRFGPASGHPLPAEAAKRFSIQSMLAMAIYPKGDEPYMLGLHQCSYARAWTPQEERLFQEIGRRLEDALTSLLMFRSLRESERRLEEAQRISHVGYWERDLATNRYTWSDENYRIFGLRPQERRLSFDDVQALLHPADRAMRAAAVAEALRGGRRYDVEYRVVRPDGEVRFVRSEGDVVRDGSGRLLRVFGTVQDITERKRAEHRRMAQHAVTHILAEATTLEEATPDILRAVCDCLGWDLGALWRDDREAGVLRCIEMWRKESVEVPDFEAASRESTLKPGVGLPGRAWLSRKPAFIPDVVQDANFLRAPIAAREGLHAALAIPILLGGEVLGVMEFFSHEIRRPDPNLLNIMATIGSQIGQFIERKRAEDALHRAQAELAHVTRVATLGELTASIAHEINQPLAAVVNNATACVHWLAAQNLEEARQSAEAVIADGHRAGEIIARIRALATKAPSRKDWVDVNETILEVVALARSEVQSNGVSLRARLAEDLPLILGDRIQLQQVLLNLIINAIEAMNEVSDAPRELFITSAKDDSQGMLVAVRDSGPGLDPGGLDRLFHAFYTTKPQGMGMGLAISRSIVEAHGGRLWATANVPRGAVFQFTLPIDADKVG
ncbi:MAG: PAS domain S-box protein [Actinobacteria bacterium]|nr:MAG: PAS domain S-box protein [Actinomycetota bacterium]